MQKIYLWADASVQIGFGHFVRTLALADILKNEFDCTFFTQTPTLYQQKEIENVCKLVTLPQDENKFNIFLSHLDGSEIVFLDNYFFTSDYQKLIKSKGCRLVVLSPCDKHHYADIVLNFLETDISKYSIEPYTRVYAGIEWSLLRKAFIRPIASENRVKGKITISFGGTDQFCLTEKVVDALNSDHRELHCICTSRVDSYRLKKLSDNNVKLHIDVGADEVSNLFETSECAILSSSGICLEALSRKCKVISGYYVDNQIRFHEALISKNLVIDCGDYKNFDFTVLQAKLSNLPNTKLSTILFSDLRQRYINIFRNLCL